MESESSSSSFEIDEEDKSKIAEMRAVVLRREGGDTKEVEDLALRRFLRARDMDVDKASDMFIKFRRWRQSFVPHGSISEDEVAADLAHNKLFMQGIDRAGRPIVVLLGGRHKQGNLQDFKRFVVYTLDKICARMPKGQEKFVAIVDMGGWGYSNIDIHGSLASLSILQDCYPERQAKVFMVHVPYAFMTVWKMMYPFIDAKTKKKIVFVNDKSLKSTLLADIDDTQLLDIYGGKLPLVPIQDC